MKKDLKSNITDATRIVTSSWKKAKRSADKNDRVSRDRIDRMRHAPLPTKIRHVAFREMERAYNVASSNGKYYANARQIMYVVRPIIMDECDISKLDTKYFTQRILKDFLVERRPKWKIVWDDRGHIVEPYTGIKIGLGGLGIKNYMDTWHLNIDDEIPIKHRIDTKGPGHRFSNVLFIEKEGFTEMLVDVGIPERYDMAIMSTKGIPVDAACDLIKAMDSQGVRTFVLRDFDWNGFKIIQTLRKGTRLSLGTNVIDLGFRMADIEGLPSETFYYDKRQRKDPRIYLTCYCDATYEESQFLVWGRAGYQTGWYGRRVEINAMTSEQLLTWLEQKLDKHGVEKVVPTTEVLNAVYKRAVYLQRVKVAAKKIQEELKKNGLEIPEDIHAKVSTLIKQHPRMSWDDAVWAILEKDPAGNSGTS